GYKVASIINDFNYRVALLDKIRQSGCEPLAVISARAHIHPSVHIGALSFVKDGALIDVNSYIAEACIVDNGCVIAHDNLLQPGVRLAPGVCLGSNIVIGTGSILGVGVSVNTGVKIGQHCIIGAGSSVTQNIPDYSVVEGVPGKVIGRRPVLRSNS
ncbi:MAG: hypothetical protein CUN55_13930, partial [Phototrophicales bacterium]